MADGNEIETSVTPTQKRPAAPPPLTNEQVTGYLRAHPDFFARQPELLRLMLPPRRWSSDTIVDMQRYVVESLRGELDGLRDCASSVIETSRVNMTIQTRTHEAVLALLAAGDAAQLGRTVAERWPDLLDVDAATLALEGANDWPLADWAVVPLADDAIDTILPPDRDIRLASSLLDTCPVFHDEAVASAVYARLDLEAYGVRGVLALGDDDEGTFAPGRGTELVRFLARVVSLCLARMLPVAA